MLIVYRLSSNYRLPTTDYRLPTTLNPHASRIKHLLMFSFPFTDDLPRFLVMLLLAAVLGWFAHLLAGGRVPLGFLGTILFGVLGAWLALDVVRPRIPFSLPKEPTFDGVMLVTAGVGAFLLSLLWCLVASRFSRRRW